MNFWILLLAGMAYLGGLFALAYWVDRMAKGGKHWINNPYVYALSLAVFCSAWTFYGGIGYARTHGLEFLAIFMGVSVSAPLWYTLLRKMIAISRTLHIASIADFLSSRYGKNAWLGALVTMICIMGMVPYIALQLKAIAASFMVLGSIHPDPEQIALADPEFRGTTLQVAIMLAVFTILFGARKVDTSERHEGLVGAIAFESVVKLLAVLAVGIFVVFRLFDNPAALFAQAQTHPDLAALFDLDPDRSWTWFWLMFTSGCTFLLLPRQFHMAVVENMNPKHVRRAIWLFPLYLLLINLFVFPIALGGALTPGLEDMDPDLYILGIPMMHGKAGLLLLVFLGGLSASSGMVIVSTIALSTMIGNQIVIPLLLRYSIKDPGERPDLSEVLLKVRWVTMIVILGLAYGFFLISGQAKTLMSIGLTSFLAIAQLAPSTFGGMFWRDGTRKGAFAGLIGGVLVWLYTLPFANLVESGLFDPSILTEGPFGISWLRPYAFMGLEGMAPIPHAAFWSLFVNVLLYVGVSLIARPTMLEFSQADVFVNIDRYNRGLVEPYLRPTARREEMLQLLQRFLGPNRTEQVLKEYRASGRGEDLTETIASPELIQWVERQLTGAVGASSARLLISSFVQEENPSLREVMAALDETQQILAYSRQIERKSEELQRTSERLSQANNRLREMDTLKNEFITTVTHELRTPITSIRALANILYETPGLPQEKSHEFLGIIVSESERISRLINQVLDLEKMESGLAELHLTQVDMVQVVQNSIDGIIGICEERDIELVENLPSEMPRLRGDRDRIQQVVVNLLSNAVKFCNEENGRITVTLEEQDGQAVLQVADNGAGMPKEVQTYIFDKFAQFTDSGRGGRKHGSGLGLSISWRIVRMHKGRIYVKSEPGEGATFFVHLPIEEGSVKPMVTPSYKRIEEEN
ncbi:sensor histidine kinase [Pontibacter sp. G13]|uniref:sensor histidine kinase n=1 Tax=Pontibacter sp. G13 TaxID=3074898 RepID=UPI002889FDE5|nr:sensor histidine kinase [Pontibacter sp. G13]WNJ18057.1 sensor histidine kinase [Pontibacter sp. G13]